MATLREQANEKLVERRRLIEANRSLVDEFDGKDWPDDKRAEYDRRWEDIERLKNESDILTRQAAAEDGIDPEPSHRPDVGERTGPVTIEREFRSGPNGHITGKRVYQLEGSEEERAAARRRFLIDKIHPQDRTAEEKRALQMDSDTAGGFTVAPQQFVADVIQAVDDRLFLRGLARVDQLIGAHSIGRPSLDTDPADADWTTEIKTGSEDSSMAFGKRELSPHPLAKLLKISRTLLRHSSNIESLVRERLAYKLAVPQESAFMTGSGAQQPLGLFTASSDGISTGRDVSTGNTSTSIQFDGLKEAKWTLKQQYWNRSQWIFHRDAGKQIDKLKDGNGQYQWQPSVVVGQPDRLLNLPVNFSEYAPNTFTTGQYVGILGDYSNYWIVESLSMEMIRLNELYAGTNQVGFITRAEIDAMPVLEEAFVRIKLG